MNLAGRRWGHLLMDAACVRPLVDAAWRTALSLVLTAYGLRLTAFRRLVSKNGIFLYDPFSKSKFGYFCRP
jgi:hypothetical protein